MSVVESSYDKALREVCDLLDKDPEYFDKPRVLPEATAEVEDPDGTS